MVIGGASPLVIPKGLVYRREKREKRGLALLFARASARDPPVSSATEARVLFSQRGANRELRRESRVKSRVERRVEK